MICRREGKRERIKGSGWGRRERKERKGSIYSGQNTEGVDRW